MGDVVDFPTKDEEPGITEFHVLVYKWWMKDFYPMFKEGGKLAGGYMVYGEMLTALYELWEEGYIEIVEDEERLGLGMEAATSHVVYETVIGAYNMTKEDSHYEDETDEQLH